MTFQGICHDASSMPFQVCMRAKVSMEHPSAVYPVPLQSINSYVATSRHGNFDITSISYELYGYRTRTGARDARGLEEMSQHLGDMVFLCVRWNHQNLL